MKETPRSDKDFRYIAIEGPIGVGKTSLARRLAEDYNARLILEKVDDNPFLELFYSGDQNVALPTQLYFLLSRAQQLNSLWQEDMFSSMSISDFVIEKDPLFAALTLEPTHLKLYQGIYHSVVKDYPQPDLVVYLQAPLEVLVQRIAKRGRDFERNIETQYIQKLSQTYNDFFYHYDKTPLLIINTEGIDFVKNDEEYLNLKSAIESTRSGKRYYNPLPTDDLNEQWTH